MLFAMLMLAQITKAPEFEETAKVHTSAAAGTVDGSSHVSAERAAVNRDLLVILRKLPEAAEGVRLIESQMTGEAQSYFERKHLAVGKVVTLFLAGKADASAELLLQLVAEKPRGAGLLAVLGETVGTSASYTERMLTAIRKLTRPETAEGEYYLARALLKQEPARVDEARAHLSRSAELDPQETRALLESARHAESPQAGVAALVEALRRDERLPVAHYRLAQLYRAEGKAELSRRHLRRFEELRQSSDK